MSVPMWQVIIKNNSGSAVIVEDLGLEVLNGAAVNVDQEYAFDEIAGSDSLRELVEAGTLVVNDGTSDLSSTDGVYHLTLDHQKFLQDEYYDMTELQTSGQAQVHWGNITNVPSFGSPSWINPVLYRVLEVASSAPASPSVGDVYVDSNTDHYMKWDGSAWQDEGAVSTDDRIIDLSNGTENVFTWSGSAWTDGGTPGDNSATTINDDGDGKNAQYVYSTETSEWIKFADVDFESHLDGGASKHDASEIDVEGTYTSAPSTPTDLETVLSEYDTTIQNINTNLTGLSLDDAYDGNGSGAGRTVTVDSQAVKFDASSGTDAPLELTSLAAAPTTNLANGQLSVIDGILCAYDSTRGKWLSVNREVLVFGRRGRTRNQYLAFGGGVLPSNNSGFRIMRNATITAMSCQLDASGTGTINLRKNDVTASNIASLAVTSATGNQDISVNVDLAQTDFLQCACASTAGIEDPIVIVEIAYRF